MFFLFAGDILARSEGAAVAVSSDVDHDGNRLILIQIIAERSTLWEATKLLDGG